jgi:hypothetical protein
MEKNFVKWKLFLLIVILMTSGCGTFFIDSPTYMVTRTHSTITTDGKTSTVNTYTYTYSEAGEKYLYIYVDGVFISKEKID